MYPVAGQLRDYNIQILKTTNTIKSNLKFNWKCFSIFPLNHFRRPSIHPPVCVCVWYAFWLTATDYKVIPFKVLDNIEKEKSAWKLEQYFENVHEIIMTDSWWLFACRFRPLVGILCERESLFTHFYSCIEHKTEWGLSSLSDSPSLNCF